ncbi:hypothetical protein M6D93_04705 [Jatrophihabitans telluris]|uniref:Uncharacterized protein n=1 Tax=Jatrophihabitans telluris TaxID=2038343 RepID=A0ABY4R1W0_9ACTN|nr:hypothetical protein [Jatrophihabitans telluris]UQX89307.1 hypothetical protein M6D93_04705 [Jatrophihabitans telluris]
MASKASQWPSIHEQLEAARAPAGSAYEQLIRNHQDFSILPANEYDPMDLPPWLKVWWRTEHPEIDESNGPVAYPLILERIWEYMRRNPDDPIGAAKSAQGPDAGGPDGRDDDPAHRPPADPEG